MTEQFCALSNGLRLCYCLSGEGEPLLLIMGLGLQMIAWPKAMVDGLTARGFQVIVFDNRDVGRSSRVPVARPSTTRLFLRRARPSDYDLADMAQDAAELLEHLGIPSAHVAGMSMGGMIGQTLAALRPEKVRSLTSIFSSTGARNVGQPSTAAMLRLMLPPVRSREAAVKRFLGTMRLIAGRGYPINEKRLASYIADAWDRDGAIANEGILRQIAAMLKSGDRTTLLGRITAPTLVVHGDRDLMVHPSGGKATATAIKGARLVTIEGMGHDLADGVIPQLADHISENAARAG